MGIVNHQAARFLIAPLDNLKKMFSPLLAESARAFRTLNPGDVFVAIADRASRQVCAFWKNLCRDRIAWRSGLFGRIACGFVASRIDRMVWPRALFAEIQLPPDPGFIPGLRRRMGRGSFSPSKAEVGLSRPCPVRDCRRFRLSGGGLIVRRPRKAREGRPA